MRSIEARLKKCQKRNPSFGDYICLMQAVYQQGFTRRTIYNAFKKFIPSDDYLRKEVPQLISQLEVHTKRPEDDISGRKKGRREASNNKHDPDIKSEK